MRQFVFPAIALSLVLLTGCASYSALPLNSLSSQIIQFSLPQEEQNVMVAAKAFTKADCKRYLDRDVIGKGYQPVQLYIQNNSDKCYLFSLSRISLSCARPEEVAEKVHTSTAGRAAGYGAAAFFTCGLFAIPAVIDGVKSAQANEALDSDFSAKTAMDQTIQPHSYFNKIIFVPVNEYQSTFTMALIDQASGAKKAFNVNVTQ